MCFCTANPRWVGPRCSVCGRRSVPAEVEPGTESAPGPGEDHHARLRVDRDRVELVVQRLHHLRRHRVQRVGTVQRELHHTGDGFGSFDCRTWLHRGRRCFGATRRGWYRRPDACGRSAHTGARAQSVRAHRSPSIASTLAPFRHGRIDPTTVLRSVGRGRTASGTFLHATLTPDGPGTVRVRWKRSAPEPRRWDIDAYGSGGEWLAGRIPRMLGSDDAGMAGVDTAGWSPTVTTALHASRHVGDRRQLEPLPRAAADDRRAAHHGLRGAPAVATSVRRAR